MASEWRLNVERVGAGGYQWWQLPIGSTVFVQVDLVGELITPVTFLGITYTHMFRLYSIDGLQAVCFGHLLMGTLFFGAIPVQQTYNHWPYGIAIHPDHT